MLGKWLGAALIIGATTYGGWQVASAFARRPRELRALQTGLAVLQTEVEYGATPLPEALASAGAAAGGVVAEIFLRTAVAFRDGEGMTAGDGLRHALAEVGPATALTPEDLAVLSALSNSLGASGRADQVRHLTLARERLAAEEERAQEERGKYERAARYIGVLSGAAIVLVFL